PEITALVCVSDVLALAAIAEITARGRRVGADVAVIGFDDTDVAEMAGLSSVHQPLDQVAGACIRAITARLDSPGDERPPERVLLTPTLIVRASSGAG